jgi:hypothetical protein
MKENFQERWTMRVRRTGIGTGLWLLLCTLGASAQSISGPSLGFLSNEKGSTIWPVLGILGAAVPGQPLTLPEDITGATISPQHDYALAIASVTGQPVLVRLETTPPAISPISGGRTHPDLIAISPTGTAAALYQKESELLQIVSGMPADPRIVQEFNTSGLGDIVRAVAVSDDANLALVNTGNENPALWLLNANGSVSQITAAQPSHMTFMARRSDAIVADDATQEVFLLQGLDGNPVRSPGVVLRESGRPFSAVGGSADGRLIFVAQQESADVTVVHLESRATTTVSCYCTPTTFAPLKGISAFRLNALSNGPITVLDASSSSPRTLIIPIDPTLAGYGEQ